MRQRPSGDEEYVTNALKKLRQGCRQLSESRLTINLQLTAVATGQTDPGGGATPGVSITRMR